MRILFVSDYGTPTGGAEIQFGTLRAELERRGHVVRLFSSTARPSAGDSAADYQCLGTTSRWRTLLQSANPWAWWGMRRALADFRPDVVHVKLLLTQLSPLILPPLRHVPCVYHAVWYRAICPLGTKMLPDGRVCPHPVGPACLRERCLPLHDWLPLMLQQRMWQRWRHVFDAVVANSAATRRRLQADGFGAVEVIGNGVAPPLHRASLAATPTVVFAGRLVAPKGADVLIQAMQHVVAQVPHARLLIAGDGPDGDRLRRQVAAMQLDSSVIFLGRLERAALEQHFAGAWVQAVPSRWEEPFGNVVIEAAMRGSAVVASDAGGLAELVRDGATGLLVPPNNSHALALALVAVLSDRARAERLGVAAHAWACAAHTPGMVADRFLMLYNQAREVAETRKNVVNKRQRDDDTSMPER